jgi:glyoxylate reductase
MAEVAVTYPIPGGGLDRLRAAHAVRVHVDGAAVGGAELAAFVGDAQALVPLVSNRVDTAVFAACPRLCVVANVGVGVNNIDLHAAAAAGVWVTNTPDVLTEATADLTWGLILAVTRRIVEGDRVVREGAFPGWRPDYMLGVGLQGKTLGIVGMGRIGRAVARRAPAFGMTVRFADPEPPTAEARSLGEWVAELDDLLPQVDVLSLHTPLLPATARLIDARRLRLLRRGAFLVNASRGEVVDEAGLVEVLSEGHLGGAALDVFEHEPAVHPGLLARRDVVLLPHLGSATRETREAMADLAVDNALAVLSGRRPATVVVEGRPL